MVNKLYQNLNLSEEPEFIDEKIISQNILTSWFNFELLRSHSLKIGGLTQPKQKYLYIISCQFHVINVKA